MAVKWSGARLRTVPAPAVVRSARQLSTSEVDELVARYQAGATVRQLATEFGVHRATVGRHLEARGINTRQLKLSREVLKEAGELYLDGAILEELAAQYRVSYTTIRRCLVD